MFFQVKANERTFTAGVSYTDPRIDMVSDRIVELCRNSGSVTQANVCAQTAACFMRMDQGVFYVTAADGRVLSKGVACVDRACCCRRRAYTVV